MNNLYSKLYEAIDAGIQKALVLPDEMTDDISVRFHHKKLSNDFDIMDEYVRNLLDGNDIEYYYEQILEYYEETHKKYKVNDFKELSDMFDKIKDIRPLNMKWIDMSNAITIILDGILEIPFDQFNSNIHTVKFIKFKNNITGHDIILHKDLLAKTCQWIIKDKNILNFNNTECINVISPWDKAVQIVKQDYNGYEHTYHNADIESNKRNISDYPAFKYCMEDLMNIDQKYEAYLPAIGELLFLYNNQYLINYILEKVKGKRIYFNGQIWSSTEYSDYFALHLHSIQDNRVVGKNNALMVLPIFTLK